MPKNIVICCDGTGNEFGNANSNVEKVYSVLTLDDGRQIAYYRPGVGTMGAPSALLKITKWWTKMLGMLFGYGITANMEDAYEFLMDEFEPGDQVFVFGFSRGAYTARALCSMLRMYGLLRKGNVALVRYVSRMLRHHSQDRFPLAAEFKRTFSRPCCPHFVGVWDTVSSIGWIYDPVQLPYTARNTDISIGRHAVSIDERRCFYRPNLWQPAPPAPGAPGVPQDIKQVWFAGVHSDVGGSYPEPESGLSKLSLRWMLGEACAAGLRVDPRKVACVLGEDPANPHCTGFSRADVGAQMHPSPTGWWWILEFLPKRFSEGVAQPDGQTKWVKKWQLPLAARRRIKEGSLIHHSVPERLAAVPAYRPKNLPQTYEAAADLAVVPPPPAAVSPVVPQ